MTIFGEQGEQLFRSLGEYLVGQAKLEDLGPGVDRATDGTLRLLVDLESFEALGLSDS